ncbi:hypothetical protein Amir_7015 [Actinosynnema mirum DSM 43827]|uniref:Uncharacterized protein n=1 Tax=Actinosynnema mirum (strain ATCC 29888 / DSM 43827 / JCM 3225 / NBRC 14064 / NCIMB 13271 / NRRL B-12336 / IMRU 3971 / 101) TaxID=446462 RepID=C6WSD7_ACTMD|nr:hypothetical protein Amir_7015 [Actinosynnema mirum DSM 43827]
MITTIATWTGAALGVLVLVLMAVSSVLVDSQE